MSLSYCFSENNSILRNQTKLDKKAKEITINFSNNQTGNQYKIGHVCSHEYKTQVGISSKRIQYYVYVR